MPPAEENRWLIARATEGDRLALEKLLLNNYNRLAKYIAAKLPASTGAVLSAEDILQQAFLHAFRDIRNFEARSDASFYAWLKTIAENRLIDTVKALKRKKRGGEHQRVHNVAELEAGSVVDLVEMLSGLHIRCPNCHNPVEITLNRAITVIDCDCCGNRRAAWGHRSNIYYVLHP